jgi:glutathione S-transferase
VRRDRLIILKAGFGDPAFPGQTFYCWHCALMEGVLASFPELLDRIEVERIAWPRPRHEVIALVGEDNQSLPVLVLADGETSHHQTGTHNGRAFISDKDAILAALAERHGIPVPHP